MIIFARQIESLQRDGTPRHKVFAFSHGQDGGPTVLKGRGQNSPSRKLAIAEKSLFALAGENNPAIPQGIFQALYFSSPISIVVFGHNGGNVAIITDQKDAWALGPQEGRYLSTSWFRSPGEKKCAAKHLLAQFWMDGGSVPSGDAGMRILLDAEMFLREHDPSAVGDAVASRLISLGFICAVSEALCTTVARGILGRGATVEEKPGKLPPGAPFNL